MSPPDRFFNISAILICCRSGNDPKRFALSISSGCFYLKKQAKMCDKSGTPRSQKVLVKNSDIVKGEIYGEAVRISRSKKLAEHFGLDWEVY